MWRSGWLNYAGAMTRIAALAILGLVACSAAPGFAQSNSELLGGPGYQAAEEQAAKRAAARKQVEDQIAQARARTARQADQAAASKQADARKAERERLAKQAEDLKVREAQLRAREEELAAEQERIARQLAEIEKGRTVAEAEAPPSPPVNEAEDEPLAEDPARDERPGAMRLDASIRSCEFAGEDKALARDYLSARYVRAPRFFERQSSFDDVWELRGVMRVEDRRGYLLADTVCELDRRGRVQDFAFLRSGY
jgi:flagellar motility protein MotE (MotC chaperone)